MKRIQSDCLQFIVHALRLPLQINTSAISFERRALYEPPLLIVYDNNHIVRVSFFCRRRLYIQLQGWLNLTLQTTMGPDDLPRSFSEHASFV